MAEGGDIKFPDEWFTAPWSKCELLQVLTITRSGKKMFFAGGHLDDGTLLYGLSFPGGQHVARLAPSTRWAIEERFKGKPPHADRRTVAKTWRLVIQSLITSKKEAEKKLGPPPAEASP